MSQFNIADAKSRFSELVQKALTGEEVVIAKDNKPILKLVPVANPRKRVNQALQKGKFSLLHQILMSR